MNILLLELVGRDVAVVSEDGTNLTRDLGVLEAFDGSFLRLRKAHVEVTWHDNPDLGHAVEVHRSSPELIALNDGFAQAARDWDGSEPLRPMPTPAYTA